MKKQLLVLFLFLSFITVNAQVLTATSTITQPLCFGDSNGAITVLATGGTAPYTFSLMQNGSTLIAVGPSNVFSYVFTNLNAGSYTVTVSDSSTPTQQVNLTVTLTQPIPLTLTTTTVNSTIVATGSGGNPPFGYRIIAPVAYATPYSSSGVFTNISPGTYTIEVIDGNGCTATANGYLMSVVANNDNFTIYPVNGNIATSVTSLFGNDYNGGAMATPPSFVISPSSLPTGFAVNPNGTISVLPGTPSGVYTFQYLLSAVNNPLVNDPATVTVMVVNEGIIMNAFIDSNANGIMDNGEIYFSHGQFGYELNDSGTVNYVTASNGAYFINESNPANSYDLSYTIDPEFAAYYNLSISSYPNVSFNSVLGVTTYSFPVQPLPFSDLQVIVSQSGTPPRPGFIYNNWITYRNNGNQVLANGTLTFTKDNAVTITNISQSGTTATANGFSYDFVNLLPGESRNINVTLQVPSIPTVNLGQLLTNSVTGTVLENDTNTDNNACQITQVIVGSYDPNDKVEAHGGKILHSNFTSNDYLTYTIQFENTGTYQAENVKVVDILDIDLDETSVKMVDASHGYALKRVGNNLSWSFEGIDLPPSVANSTIGKGYIIFQVKPKPGYAVGDIIPNTANIYFDFNPAIVTNTFNTEFVAALSMSDFEIGEFTMYPNPTNGLLTISSKSNSRLINNVVVIDVLGKTVQTNSFNTSKVVLDLSNLNRGVYFVKVQSEGLEKIIKVVKQ